MGTQPLTILAVIVLDDYHPRRLSRGSSMVKVAPAPGSLVTVIAPPCARTIARAMGKPSPEPSGGFRLSPDDENAGSLGTGRGAGEPLGRRGAARCAR